MEKIIQLYTEYQNKKWFPKTNPDPLGALIDFINEEDIRGIIAQYKSSGNRGLLQIALELSELLPINRFRDAYRDYASVYEKKLSPAQCRPEFTYFHLRRLDTEDRNELWNNLHEWAESSKTRMLEWHTNRIAITKSFQDLRSEYESAHGINRDSYLARIEKWLKSTKDQFDFEFHRYADVKTLPEVLAAFRLKNWDFISDWNDFPDLSRSFLKAAQIEKAPALQKSEVDDAIQACLHVYPPRRVVLEYGSAAGPCDSARFISEFAKSISYSNMNPDVPDEFRFSGDPRLSEFWRQLFLLGYTSKAGLRNVVGDMATDLSAHLTRFVSFWLRYDAFLAIYKNSAEADLQTAEDSYAENWRKAFSLDVPSRLYLFELDRSVPALSRVQAMEAAIYAQEQFRTMYGNAWLSSSQCISRLKDFWWEGFKLDLRDVLQDLNIKIPEDLNLTVES